LGRRLTPDEQKRAAGEAAAGLVEAGMTVGLGTGSTAAWFVRALAARAIAIRGVATSEATAALARSLGIPLIDLDEARAVDLTVDGADEIGPGLSLIKGGGAALLREKLVWEASRRCVVIADAGKRVKRLGAFPLPIEVVPFGLAATRRHIEIAAAGLDCRGAIALRRARDSNAVFVTDGGHYILDCAFGAIADPDALAAALSAIPGIVEHGLFIGIASAAILAGSDGLEFLGDLA